MKREVVEGRGDKVGERKGRWDVCRFQRYFGGGQKEEDRRTRGKAPKRKQARAKAMGYKSTGSPRPRARVCGVSYGWATGVDGVGAWGAARSRASGSGAVAKIASWWVAAIFFA